jgi:hypothetical protein
MLPHFQIKGFFMRFIPTTAIVLTFIAMNSQAQDVIYKKDGSILKGVLLEQNFENGTYKIQLAGGSIFVVKEGDIDKMTTEETKAVNNSAEAQLEVIAEESRARLDSNRVNSLPIHGFNSQVMPFPITDTKQNQSSFYIGTLSHSISYKFDAYLTQDFGNSYYIEEVEAVDKFKGIKLGFQTNYSKHIASHLSLSRGSFDSSEVISSDGHILESLNSSELPDISYLGLSASIIASTNLQKGWQFSTGLGILRDSYSHDFGTDTYTSLGLELGMGYSWEKIQLGLQYQGVLTGDYDSDLDVSNLHLQLGINI